MHAPTRRSFRFSKAPALMLVLAITTGWGDATAGQAAQVDAAAGSPIAPGPLVLDRAPTGSTNGFSSAIFLHERVAQPEPASVEAPAPVKRVAKEKPARESKPAKVTQSGPTRPTYSGENRFWIPSLGISNRVHLFPCSRQRPPDNYMYRWGCAGENNVYIMGHAYSVMKPLHDAYARGTLRVGMVAIYANASGKVTKYRVTEWRVVDPVDSHWAIADQPVKSMTLQTCVGRDGRLRLNVRLVAVD